MDAAARPTNKRLDREVLMSLTKVKIAPKAAALEK